MLTKEGGAKVNSSESFRDLRIRAEKVARELKNGIEVTLLEIYSQMEKETSFSERELQRAQELECELEGRSLRAVPAIRKEVLEAYKAGIRVLFISDMYLPASLIQEWLIREGYPATEENLFVSSEFGETKHRGGLYRVVQKRLGLHLKDWRHCGDNQRADVMKAKAFGIKAREFSAGRLNRFEKLLVAQGPATASLAAACRLARLSQIPLADQKQQTVYETSCSFTGVLHYLFVDWLIHKADEEGIEELVFVSRDGQMPAWVAEQVIASRGLSLKSRYIYGSRKAWQWPRIVEGRLVEDDLEWVLSRSGGPSLRIILERLRFQENQFQEVLIQLDYPAQTNLDEKLTRQECIEIGKKLTSGLSAFADVEKLATEERELAKDYFRSLELKGPFCLVDVGWSGRLMKAGLELAKEAGLNTKRAKAAFFSVLPNGKSRCDQEDWWYLTEARKIASWPGCGCGLVEELFAADEGSLLNYKEVSGKIETHLRTAHNEELSSWPLRQQHDGIRHFVDELVQLPETGQRLETSLVVPALISEFFSKPTSREAFAYGSLPHESDVVSTDSASTQLVPELPKNPLLRLIQIITDKKLRVWPEALNAQGNKWDRLLMKLAQAFSGKKQALRNVSP